MMQKAIFPLPVVLYPGGITRLRIFEQRYLRMVKESSGDVGFVLSVYDADRPTQLSQLGSWVKIIDFDQLEDGTLGIDVQSQWLMSIDNATQDPDLLNRAEVDFIDHWPQREMEESTQRLAQRLKVLFDQTPLIKQLYTETHMDDPNWVCCRWLEVLPINPSVKAMFYAVNSFDHAVELLSTVVLAQKPLGEALSNIER